MAVQLPADENVGSGIEDSAKEPAHRVVCVHVSADGPPIRSAYLTESAPAFAACPSCSLVPPDAPMAPTILPPMTRGRPPSTGTAPCSPRNRTPPPPPATPPSIPLAHLFN